MTVQRSLVGIDQHHEFEVFERCKIAFIASLLADLGVHCELSCPPTEYDIERLGRRLRELEGRCADLDSAADFSLILIAEVWVKKSRPDFTSAHLEAQISLWRQTFKRLRQNDMSSLRLAVCNSYMTLLGEAPLLKSPDEVQRECLLSRLQASLHARGPLVLPFLVDQLGFALRLPVGKAACQQLRQILHGLANNAHFKRVRHQLATTAH
jgi:hypothetical protein